jgi:hypothetical protein
MRRCLSSGTLVAAALLVAAPALAKPIRIDLVATVTGISDEAGLLGGSLAVGDRITGSYTYELDGYDSNPYPNLADYWHYREPYGIELRAGPLTFLTDPSNVVFRVSLNNGFNGEDAFSLASYYNLPLPNGSMVDEISWALGDPSQTALSDVNPPAQPPVLENWPVPDYSPGELLLMGRGANFWDTFSVWAHVTAVSLPPVCSLGAVVTDAALTLSFDVATDVATQFNLFLSYSGESLQLASVPIPAITATPAWTFDNPRAGKIGFLATLVTGEGISCSDWVVVDTGRPPNP